jgi:hypothetical protein
MIISSYERKPHLPRAEFMRREIERRGLTLERTDKAWHITGHGVDVTVSALEHLTTKALEPYQPEG